MAADTGDEKMGHEEGGGVTKDEREEKACQMIIDGYKKWPHDKEAFGKAQRAAMDLYDSAEEYTLCYRKAMAAIDKWRTSMAAERYERPDAD